MRSVVYQNNARFRLPTDGTYTLSSGVLRSRTRTYEGGSCRGMATNAIICDNTHIQFEVRPQGGARGLANIESLLTVRRFAIGGGWDGVDFLAAYPNASDDVSGQLQNMRGNLMVDATDDAVYEARLQLTNRGAPLAFQCLVTVFAELLPVEVDVVSGKKGLM